jgi:PleD family two-component response regulator
LAFRNLFSGRAHNAADLVSRPGSTGESLRLKGMAYQMKILICDDHEVFRSGLRAALAGLAAEIFEAACCREALEIIA